MPSPNRRSSIRTLCAAYFFSKLGDFAFETAFAVAIIKMTNANILTVGLIYFFRYLPCVIFSPIGGWLADHSNKKTVLMATELLKFPAGFLLYMSFESSSASLMAITALSMVLTALDCLYAPTFRNCFPGLTAEADLPAINSRVQMLEDIASILGPLTFAAVSIVFSTNVTFLIFAVLGLVTAGFVITIRALPRSTTAAISLLAAAYSTTSAIRELRHSNSALFKVIACTTACALFATSLLRFILPTAILESFGSEEIVGYVLALLSGGTVIGSALYVKINRLTTPRLVFKFWMTYGALFLATALAIKFNAIIFLTFVFLLGFSGAFVDIAIITNIQQLSASNDTGRNFSLYHFSAVMGDAASGLLACIAYFLIGPATLIGMTLTLCLAPLPWALSREKRRTPG
ncbi:MFS transporter [Pseudomonas putida]